MKDGVSIGSRAREMVRFGVGRNSVGVDEASKVEADVGGGEEVVTGVDGLITVAEVLIVAASLGP